MLDCCDHVALSKVLSRLPQIQESEDLTAVACQHGGMHRLRQPRLLATQAAALPLGIAASQYLLEAPTMDRHCHVDVHHRAL